MAQATSKDGTTIAYDKVGQGPTVVLVNGAMSYRAYRGEHALAAELASDFTVILYDRRGRGESSDTHPYAVEREIEDVEALINEIDAPVYLYGFSSGAVLALKISAALGARIIKLAVLEPPFNGDDEHEKQDFARYCQQMTDLLQQGRKSDAVAFFLADMLPVEMIEEMKHSPDWKLMEDAAPTLAYDNLIMGDGSVPVEVAASVTVPVLVLEGSESPAFKHSATDALTKALPYAQRRTIEGQNTLVAPEILAPILKEFFRSS